MDLSSTVLSLKWNGDEYKVKYPSVKAHMLYSKTLKEKKGKEGECLIDFLESLGLPKKVSYEMELGHLKQVAETISGGGAGK